MPQRPIPDYWKERVFSEVALLEQEGQRVSDKAIERRLKNHANDLWNGSGPEDRELARTVPSARSIGRIRKNEWEPKADSEKAQYRYFYWPESMERGDLPWELSEAALALLGYVLHSKIRGIFGRPSVRLVRWFWRVSVAAPDLPIASRLVRAYDFTEWELVGGRPREFVRGIEGELALAPWRSKDNEVEYYNAIEEGIILETPLLAGPSLDEKVQWYKRSLGIDQEKQIPATEEDSNG